MDTLDQYRAIIERTLKEAAAVPSHYGEIKDHIVCDRQNDVYLWLTVGWNKAKRVHACVVHIEIIAGKIWIQRDQTEYGMAKTLEEAGIPKNAIVLGFHPADVRPLTEYAAT